MFILERVVEGTSHVPGSKAHWIDPLPSVPVGTELAAESGYE